MMMIHSYYVEMTDRGSLDRLSRCIHCLQHWFLRNHLLLNRNKSDAIIIGTAQRHVWMPQPAHLRVAESCVAVSDSLKLLGVTLDRTMSFDKHVSTVVRACNFNGLLYGTSGHSFLTRSHSRSLAALWDPGWITVTRC